MNNKDLVLNYLKEGNTLTAIDGFTKFNIVSVRDYISMLKKDGHKIISEWRKSLNGKRYKVYWLSKDLC